MDRIWDLLYSTKHKKNLYGINLYKQMEGVL